MIEWIHAQSMVMYEVHSINHHQHQIAPQARISLTLFLSPSISTVAPGRYSKLHPCPYRVVVDNFLLVDQYWNIHVKVSIGECHFWVRLCFSSSVLFVIIDGFRDRRLGTVQLLFASMISSSEFLAFLCSSRLVFSLTFCQRHCEESAQ